MEAKITLTRGHRDCGARLCRCRNEISTKDPHQICSSCLGLEHTRLAIDIRGSCQHCAVFIIKNIRRRLARQASLSGHDPYLPYNSGAVEAGEEMGVVVVVTLEASASWGCQLNLAVDPPQEEDVLELDYGDDEDAALELLIS